MLQRWRKNVAKTETRNVCLKAISHLLGGLNISTRWLLPVGKASMNMNHRGILPVIDVYYTYRWQEEMAQSKAGIILLFIFRSPNQNLWAFLKLLPNLWGLAFLSSEYPQQSSGLEEMPISLALGVGIASGTSGPRKHRITWLLFGHTPYELGRVETSTPDSAAYSYPNSSACLPLHVFHFSPCFSYNIFPRGFWAFEPPLAVGKLPLACQSSLSVFSIMVTGQAEAWKGSFPEE